MYISNLVVTLDSLSHSLSHKHLLWSTCYQTSLLSTCNYHLLFFFCFSLVYEQLVIACFFSAPWAGGRAVECVWWPELVTHSSEISTCVRVCGQGSHLLFTAKTSTATAEKCLRRPSPGSQLLWQRQRCHIQRHDRTMLNCLWVIRLQRMPLWFEPKKKKW